MLKNISLIFSIIALLLAGAALILQQRSSGEKIIALSERVARIEQDVEEIFNRPAHSNANSKLQNTLAFTVLRAELEKMKKEITAMRTNIVGGTAQKEAISNICVEEQAHRWEDMASTLSTKFMAGFTGGLQKIALDDDVRESIVGSYNTLLQDTTANQVDWMKGRIDATELSERMGTSAVDFRSVLDENVSPRLSKKILILAFPDPGLRSQLFPRDKR
ncbi:hypothetical protein KAH37_05105 [bacterium]|nr:hypothetical protein [bacterium]